MTRTNLPQRLLAITTLVSSLFLPFTTHAQAVGNLIKGSSSTVYFKAQDGKRYVFPSSSVFTSWFTPTTEIDMVSDSVLANLPLGGVVTYRPGSTLVKITTNPRVYAVSRYGVLHWITNESVATTLYGANWNKHILDVPDTFFTDYIVGNDISDASMYSPDAELISAVTPDGNLRPAGFVPAPLVAAKVMNTADVGISLSSSQAVLNQNVQVFAAVTNNTLPITRLEIHDESSNQTLAECDNSDTCSYSFKVTVAPQTTRYFAVATDNVGNVYQTSVVDRSVLTVNSTTDQIHISATPMTVSMGSRASFTSDASALQTVTSHKIYAIVPGNPTAVLWKDCGATSSCASSTPFYRTTALYSQVVSGSQTFVSGQVTVTVTGGDAPKPKLSVTGHPSSNQIDIDIAAPTGEMVLPTSLVDGTTLNDKILTICTSNCSVTLQVNVPGSVTAFAWVGGKYEMSNTITVTPSATSTQ